MRKTLGLSTAAVVVLCALGGAACSRSAPSPRASAVANAPSPSPARASATPAAAPSAAAVSPAAAPVPAARRELSVAVVGAPGHGKSTLLAALAQELEKPLQGRRRSYRELKLGGKVELAFEAGGRSVTLREYPSTAEAVQALADPGSGLKGFLLVVEQPSGLARETRQQIDAAARRGLRPLALVQTKDDLVDDAELKDLEQGEIEQALVDAKLLAEEDAGTWVGGKFEPGAGLPCVRVSARRALGGDARARGAVARLLAVLEKRSTGL